MFHNARIFAAGKNAGTGIVPGRFQLSGQFVPGSVICGAGVFSDSKFSTMP
jgi:hypothetical protein